MLRFKARPRKDPTESPFLTPSQRRVISALGSAMTQVRDATIRNEGKILDAILHGPPSRLLDLVPEDPWYGAQEILEAELRAELTSAGNRYGAMIPAVQKAAVNFRFDDARPEAAKWASKESANLIVEVVEEQRAVVRDLASRASMGDMTPREAAAQVRNVIGLTSQQSGWVENFRRQQVLNLEAQGLSPAQVAERADRATDRYHKRIHRYRSENIARTEILSASHEGRREAWAQGIEEGFIAPDSEKKWSANLDGRVCNQCADLDGTVVPLAGTFPNGEPPLHPSCRCDVLLIPKQPQGMEELAALSDEELDAQISSLISGVPLAPGATPSTAPPQSTQIAEPFPSQPDFDPALATGARSFAGKTAGPAWGNKTFRKWQDTWEQEPEGKAINQYSTATNSLNYERVNGRLRTGVVADELQESVDENIRLIQDALDDAVIPEDVIAVRGFTLSDRLPREVRDLLTNPEPGDLIHDPGFMSTSLSDVPALGVEVYMRLRVPAGSRGAYLGRLSHYKDSEQELLLQSGTTVRVLKGESDQYGRMFIDAEVVAQNPGSKAPPSELLKQLLSYVSFMEHEDAVRKGAVPLEPVFDEDG
ncbi:MAG TPA: ADP-ribosyltransferase, partial [Acidimicrobiia bacterium]